MKRPGGERAACGSSSSKTAARYPRDHEPRTALWRLREQARAGHLAEVLSTVISKHQGVTDELGGVQCAGCLRQRQRVQRATSAQLREATVRAPSSVARAFGI